MHRSILLRLLPPERSGGRLAGVVEEVETGERTAFRDADDLIAALRRLHEVRPRAARTLPAGSGDGPLDG